MPLTAATARRAASWRERLGHPGSIALLLAVATLFVYAPSAKHEFVNYDDSDYVTSNVHVTGGLSWTNILWAFRTGHASNWHPLTWLSHELDCQLFGQRPGLHHLTSLLFHLANTVLLFLVLRRMTGAQWRSATVAALFALHPLHVESVAWVSERKDVLSTLFLMLTLVAYGRYVESRKQQAEGRKQKAEGAKQKAESGTRNQEAADASPLTLRVPRPTLFYVAALAGFTLGLMSKPMLVTLPFGLLLLDYWPLQRIEEGGVRGAEWRKHWARLVFEKLPFLALSLASCVVTFIAQRKGGAVSTALSLGARVQNALVSYARYIGKLFWPDDLSVLYPHPGSWPAWRVLAAAGLLVAISAAVWLVRRRQPYLLVGWLWFLGTLVPTIGLVQVGIQSMADRYTYVPLIGLFMALVWGAGEWAGRRAWRADLVRVGVPLCLAACLWLTVRQVHYWRNSETLFRRAVTVTKKNYLAYNNLGFYLSGKGRVDEAMENYRKALEINPGYEDALNNLGYALAGRKRYAEAIPLYEAALRVRPNHVEVHNNLGNALSDTGRLDQAIRHYRFVLEHQPDHANAHNNLGIALAWQGKLEEAIDHFHQAIRCKPDYANAHSNLGNALAAQHKLADAIQEYQASLRLDPHDAQAHNNLGNALMELGGPQEAIGHYQEALRLNADNPEAHYNLGLALAAQGKRDEASAHYREALKLKPDYAQARKQLEALGISP